VTKTKGNLLTTRMSEEYEVLLHDLRLELQGEQRQLQKLEEDLEERDEQISALRRDYREAQEVNETLEHNVGELNHELSKKKKEIKN